MLTAQIATTLNSEQLAALLGAMERRERVVVIGEELWSHTRSGGSHVLRNLMSGEEHTVTGTTCTCGVQRCDHYQRAVGPAVDSSKIPWDYARVHKKRRKLPKRE
jgi:uncharacterized protein (DUF39 family)